MKVVVLHDTIPEQGASPDQTDVLVQAREVSRALQELGYDPETLSATLDFGLLRDRLREVRPAFVFNLVESIEGYGRLIHAAPSLLDCLEIPYTGAEADAVFLTTNKLLTKQMLREAAVPTPRAYTSADLLGDTPFAAGLYIVKSVWEHASVGLDEDSVVAVSDRAGLGAEMNRLVEKQGGECFAEAYIEGREFNLSLLGSKVGPQVLPPAEIRFEGYPEGKTRVVGYRAKWHEGSFEYLHTVRSFEFPSEDGELLQKLTGLANRCWSLFDLRGYARVDFRVDRDGCPWVLEVNVNPCLSPDAGFFAAATQAGLSFTQVVERIVADCHGVARQGKA
ncbi:MAG: ATP-grasp domain-containing protein [Thermodesulfobacteriota bacterium]